MGCLWLPPITRDDTINLEDIFSDWFAEDFSAVPAPMPPHHPTVVHQPPAPQPQPVMYNQQPGVAYGQSMPYQMQPQMQQQPQPYHQPQDPLQTVVSAAAPIMGQQIRGAAALSQLMVEWRFTYLMLLG